ncbi:MAG: uncharacterized protein PWP16_1269 [Eubacteriaceae bacterium]|nr:uncharacterized protein [Eubacteriaceae bacterium]
MNHKKLFKRYFIFSVGVIINSFGISFITKANLGTSPISSLPYTLSLGFAPSLGTFTLYMSIVLIILQIILLRKNFPKCYFLQIPVSILFSVFIDLSMSFLTFMNPIAFVPRLAALLLGCLILGFGVYLEMVAAFALSPVFWKSRLLRKLIRYSKISLLQIPEKPLLPLVVNTEVTAEKSESPYLKEWDSLIMTKK